MATPRSFSATFGANAHVAASYLRQALDMREFAAWTSTESTFAFSNSSRATPRCPMPRWANGDRKSTRLNSSHNSESRMPSSA
jgi:hypothetical protein